MTTVVDSILDDWNKKTDDEKRQGYVDLKTEYKRNPANTLTDLAGLFGNSVEFQTMLGDDMDAFTWDEFDDLVSSTRIVEKAVEMGLHESNIVFRNSATKYSGFNARPKVMNWIGTETVSVSKSANGKYTVEDTGVKSLYLAVALIIPSILNTVVFNRENESYSSDTFINASDTSIVKELLANYLNKGTDKVGVLNTVASALTVFAHKMLESVRDGVSEGSYDDSRMYALDMVLAVLEVGIVVKGNVVGDRDHIVTGTIKLDSTETKWLVTTPPVQDVYTYTSEVMGDPSDLFQKYDKDGAVDPVDKLDPKFWKRVQYGGFNVKSIGSGFLKTIQNKL